MNHSVRLEFLSFVSCFIFLLSGVTVYAQQTPTLNLYVCHNGNDSNNGSNWANAFKNLQNANTHLNSTYGINSYDGDVIVHLCSGYFIPSYIQENFRSKIESNKVIVGTANRWNFFNANSVTIQGAGSSGDSPTIMDGNMTAYAGPYLFLDITRDTHPDSSPLNFTIKDLIIQNYNAAIKIRGKNSGAFAVNDNITVQNLKIRLVGNAFDNDVNSLPGFNAASTIFDTSKAAIYVDNSDNNTITNTLFDRISNVAFDSRSVYQMFIDGENYGGLHAIYMNRSGGTTIQHNTFSNVFARGVVKMRDFSNFTVIYRNNFYDNTSAIKDQYCDNADSDCKFYGTSYAECPSWGTHLSRNNFTYNRNGLTPLNIDFDPDPSTRTTGEYGYLNQPYCNTKNGWFDINPNNYHPKRFSDVDNKLNNIITPLDYNAW